MFSSLSKRSNVPGMRSGFVAGDVAVIKQFLLYREKFKAALEILLPALEVEMPEAAFYLWPRTPLPDPEFTSRLYRQQVVSLLPGSYLAREARGVNPGTARARIARVASREETIEAARRIRAFVESPACRTGVG